MKIFIKTALGVGLLVVFLTGCQPARKTPALPQVRQLSVRTQSLTDSKKAEETRTFPTAVSYKREASIFAKVSGTATSVNFQLGETVKTGDQLLSIGESLNDPQFDSAEAGPTKQARIAVEQAGGALQNAQTAYQNLLISSQKDLSQANTTLLQAKTNQSNTLISTEGNLKTAQIAYETAKISAQQATLALENKTIAAEQALSDAMSNASLAANGATDTVHAILVGINIMTGFDENNVVNVPYYDYLSALDTRILSDAKHAYKDTLLDYEQLLNKKFPTAFDRLQAVQTLVQHIKQLTDLMKVVLDKTIVGSLLPLNSPSGTSLGGLQNQLAGYQSQINGVLTQLETVSQALTNVMLSNSSSLDGLKKSLELAQQQEKNAAQNLDNLQITTKSQLDQVVFAVSQAGEVYDSTKAKVDTQAAAAKTQVKSSELQYQNAQVALSTLLGNYEPTSPLNGLITQKLVEIGETVSTGQQLFVVSDPSTFQLQFYVDADAFRFLQVGMPVAFQNLTSFSGVVTGFSPVADATTKHFLVEASPTSSVPDMLSGVPLTAKLTLELSPKESGGYLLPLSAVTVSPNGSSIFINDQGIAKEVPVTVEEIVGDTVEIKATLPLGARVVIEGNKLLHEGDHLIDVSTNGK